MEDQGGMTRLFVPFRGAAVFGRPKAESHRPAVIRGRVIFDLVQPPIEGGSGDPEVPRNLPPGGLKGLHMLEDEESLAEVLWRLLRSPRSYLAPVDKWWYVVHEGFQIRL